MNFGYLIPRLIRHFLPDTLVRSMLHRGFIIRPGLETRSPLKAVKRYQHDLQESGFSFMDKRVLVFGYGGNYAVGCGFLHLGASHVVLCERAGFPDEPSNQGLLPKYHTYLMERNGKVEPRTEYISLIHQDIREWASEGEVPQVDLVISSSVYEHLSNVEDITNVLAAITKPNGVHIHYIDLRDHFFKYPFEMLCYSEKSWRKWLNPSSNHNRYRYHDYRRVFEYAFQQVDIRILAQELSAFKTALPRIRPEFLVGDESINAVTLIRVIASYPKR